MLEENDKEINMKKLTVLFPLCKNEDNETFVMLGKQAEEKKMPGIRNGFGGKCEAGESMINCVIRETKEETEGILDLENTKEDLKNIGYVIMDDKLVDFFVIYLENKIEIKDNSDTVDIKWFNIKNKKEFISEMLSGDDEIINELEKFINNEKDYKPFKIIKTGNEKLAEQVKNVFN